VLVQPDWCRHDPALRTAMLCNVYSAFVLSVWTSKFLNACVSFVPIPLLIPPCDSFPVHLVSRHHVTAVVTKLFKNTHFLSRRVRRLRMTLSALFVGR
jgi:hypothetical protein